MKKTLLTIAAMLMASASTFAQPFIQAVDNSGFTWNCENKEDAGFTLGFYGPACVGGDNGGGGLEEGATEELAFNWGQGGNGQMYNIMELTTPLDLSVAANRHIQVTLRNLNNATQAGMPINYTLRLENEGNTTPITTPVPLAVTGTKQVFNINLNTYLVSGETLNSVKKIIFHYDGCPSGPFYSDGGGNPASLRVSKFTVGSYVVTGINNSTSVANANLYPNPSTGMTTISGELKSVADVKITLVDMLGQEVQVISEQRTNSIDATFDVSALKKGIYSVVTNIDGAPSKSQMLVVR